MASIEKTLQERAGERENVKGALEGEKDGTALVESLNADLEV